MTGINDPSNIAEYVHDTWGDANSCMSPDDRANAVVDDVNEQLASCGVPQVGWQFNSALGDGAHFDFQTWTMELGSGPYAEAVADNADTQQQAAQVSTVYHEARHAEQWFTMARERIGLGATVAQVVQVMYIPEWVAQWAAQSPIVECDATQYASEDWYQSVYGDGAAARNQTLSDVQSNYDAYRALPEEADAWSTGDAVTDEYQQYSPQ